jgi:superfamily I DNA/RNA helicase
VDLAQRVIREGADGSLSVKSESVFAPRLKVRVHEAASAAAEAEFVTHEIEKWLGGVASFSLDTDRVSGLDSSGVSFGDIAVLVRLHALVEPVAAALRRLGLPVETVQPARARAALNALRLLRSFHDSQGRTGGGRALEGALDELQGSAVEAETVAWLRDWAGGRSASGLTLAGALESLLLEGEQDRWRRAAERVSVMSCHAAKGLEFPIVFVVACEDGVIPYIPPDAAAPADELEERRLFYVAMTRAQRVLYLTHSRKRTLFGTLRETRRTPFLQAVPQDLLHELGTKSHARDSGPRQLELDLGL